MPLMGPHTFQETKDNCAPGQILLAIFMQHYYPHLSIYGLRYTMRVTQTSLRLPLLTVELTLLLTVNPLWHIIWICWRASTPLIWQIDGRNSWQSLD
jgi:hypothetical protein